MFLTIVVLVVATLLCGIALWNAKNGHKRLIIIAACGAFVLGLECGDQFGKRSGQHMLLTENKSYYTPEIEIIPDPKHPRILTLAKIDTVWHVHWNTMPLHVPVSSPQYFVQGENIYYTKAVYYYEPK